MPLPPAIESCVDPNLILCITIVLVVLAFDFTNGFHDAANSIATIAATKVLAPFAAVLWAALFNFAALFVFDTDVGKAVGSGMIDMDFFYAAGDFGRVDRGYCLESADLVVGASQQFVARLDLRLCRGCDYQSRAGAVKL